MPLYDYACEDCGPFRAWHAMRDAGLPQDCPGCGGQAKPAMTAPFVANMNPYTRIAHQRNEKSAAEPQMVRKSRKGHETGGCSHGHKHSGHKHSGHSHPGHKHGPSRPWMIGH